MRRLTLHCAVLHCPGGSPPRPSAEAGGNYARSGLSGERRGYVEEAAGNAGVRARRTSGGH